jgi:hypothetical protein
VTSPFGAAALAGVAAGVIIFMYAVRRQERQMEERISDADVDLRLLK